MQPDIRSSNGTHPLTATAVWAKTGEATFWDQKQSRLEAGTFEAWICTACGFTEWYAKDANETLAVLTKTPGSEVRYVDGEIPQPPYR